jgi:N-acetyl-gamma-glutamyl-phosphate reductase
MKIKAGIIGGTGFTAGELIRILMHHPDVSIDFVYSTSKAGTPVSDVHTDLTGDLDLVFTDKINSEVSVVFLCLGHGNSKLFLENHTFGGQTRIIDLSNDFRLEKDSIVKGEKFIYGLPELNHESIKSAKYLANPGCFATAIQLAILPLAAGKLLKEDVHVNAVTGATGAGTALSATTNFAWRDNNFSHYKAFNHQHLAEINQSVNQLQAGFKEEILFLPNRGNFSRGIFANSYTRFDGSLSEAHELYQNFYDQAVFTHLSKDEIHMKQVVNTNKCLIHIQLYKNKLLITSVIDNLLKGASGQAVQNMNLMFGLGENRGLQLKANYF